MRKCLWFLIVVAGAALVACPQPDAGRGERVVLNVEGWEIVGSLQVPRSEKPVPAVLLLHMKPTDRTSYNRLADLLDERGIASLRIDMRGHGESVNLGSRSEENDEQAWKDAVEALKFLQRQTGIDPGRIGALGASYGGEHAAHAGREIGGVKAFVILFSGSFSEESIRFVRESGAQWLFVAAGDDGNPEVPRLMERGFEAGGEEKAKLEMFESGGHGTYLFEKYPDLEGKIADWLAEKLSK